MLALAGPALEIHLTGGDNRGVPSGTEATRGSSARGTHRPGALAPIRSSSTPDAPAARRAGDLAAQRRLLAELRADPEVQPVSSRRPCWAQGTGPDAATLARPSGPA